MAEDQPLINSSATNGLGATSGISYKFDILFLKHFGQVCNRVTKHRIVPIVLCFLLLVKLLEEYCVYQVGLITSFYYKILAERDFSNFAQHSLKSFGLILVVALIKSTDTYVSSILQVMCRQKLTEHLHHLYFYENNFYKLNVMQKEAADNPDQRITQDVDKFSNVLSTIVPALIISPFTIGYYTYVAYTTTDWIGPVSIFAYFIVGTIINKYLMSPIVNVVYQQEKCEGYFRFKHMQVRVNAESIAFQDGATVEQEYTTKKLHQLIRVQNRLFLKQYPLNISVNCFNYLGSIVSFFVLAIPIFSGRYDSLPAADLSALISKNTFVSIYLISCFSKLVSLSDDFVTLAGTTHRIAQLEKTLVKLSLDDSDERFVRNGRAGGQRLQGVTNEPLINISALSYRTPEGRRQLIDDLSVEICSGDNLLIAGSSGCGKTSLLRIIKGLWKANSGSIHVHLPQDLFFVPQKSLLTDGTLRQQIIYPHYTGSHIMTKDDEVRLMQYFQLVDLMHVYERAGGLDSPVEWNWYDVLSPGEVQRLCFVRLLYHRPILALLDEAVSAVGVDMEEKLYRKCNELQITVVSVGHRKSLVSYHKTILTFGDGGSWHLERSPQILS